MTTREKDKHLIREEPPTPPAWQPISFDARRFSHVNRQRCEEGFKHQLSDWSLSDWMTATVGELGEARFAGAVAGD
jgi:hypothetical protein